MALFLQAAEHDRVLPVHGRAAHDGGDGMTTIWEAYAEALGETPQPIGAGRQGHHLAGRQRRRRSLRSSGRPGGSVPVTRRPGRHAVLPPGVVERSQPRDGLG